MSDDQSVERYRSLAEAQLAHARCDPRLSHGRDAVVADWWSAIDAAVRTRRVATDAIGELAQTATEAPSGEDAEQHAAWERAELARAAVANEHADLNAVTLIAMLSALDALVESLVPRVRDLSLRRLAADLKRDAVIDRWPDLKKRLDPETREIFEEVLCQIVDDRLARSLTEIGTKPEHRSRPRGIGASRWENALRHAGLQARPENPLPADLAQVLDEIVVLRHALVHRAGRVSVRDLTSAPKLPYADGALIRIGRRDFRTYAAAIVAYGCDVVHRLMGSLVEAVDLRAWRSYAPLNS